MAQRLIDADKLKNHYTWWQGGSREMTMDEAKSDFDTIVDLQPIVEIVQCKDCKYFKTYPPTEEQDYTIYDCDRLVYCTDNAVGNKPDDFCSRGERRNDAEY